MMILTNYCLGTSSYKFALGQYEILYQEFPDDYLVCLCIAVTYANLAVQKFSLHKSTLAIQVRNEPLCVSLIDVLFKAHF